MLSAGRRSRTATRLSVLLEGPLRRGRPGRREEAHPGPKDSDGTLGRYTRAWKQPQM